MSEQESLIHRRGVKATVLGGIGLGLSAAATLGFANHAEKEMPLGAHQTEITPTLDGHGTLEFPGILKGRVPMDAPLNAGANIEVTDTRDIDKALHQDALIATQPQGEIDSLRSAITDIWLESASKGVLTGLFVVGGLGLVLQRKSGEQWENWEIIEKGIGLAAAVAGSTVVSVMLLQDGSIRGGDEPDKWVPVTERVPILKTIDHPVVKSIEVDKSSLSDGATSLVNSAVHAYQEAGPFYEGLVDDAESLKTLLRQPEEGETVVLQVSDRHDNIPMDAVARAIGDAGGATIVISTGDDTSVGGEWEAFSLNSLNSTFSDYEERIVVPGNHDEGPFVSQYLAGLGWHVLDGNPEEIGGITWLGDADPRSSGLGDWVDSNGETISEQSERLAEVACSVEEPLTIATHTTASAEGALVEGCVDLAIGGHRHYQIGPDEVKSSSGNIGVKYTNGTTGGAVFTFALTDKIKKDAQVTLITYKDGAPIGLQPVTITTSGEYIVQPFYELPEQSLVQEQSNSGKRVATLPEDE